VLGLSNRHQQTSDVACLALEISFSIGNIVWRVVWFVSLIVSTGREVLVIQYARIRTLIELHQRRTHVVRASDEKAQIGTSNEYMYNVFQCTVA
jgi:hypothetical protein